jgi:hypothetical protein
MESISEPKVIQVSNQRRVLTSIKKFTNPSNQTYLLGSDSQYGSSFMDGKFKIFSVADLTESAANNKQLKDTHFVETTYGVHDSEYFSFQNGDKKNEYIVAGANDGSLHIYDYTAKQSNSY